MYSVPPRPNTTQEFRMVRRARTFSLEGDPVQWFNESIVMRADALDNQTHTPWHPREPPMDYCEWSHA